MSCFFRTIPVAERLEFTLGKFPAPPEFLVFTQKYLAISESASQNAHMLERWFTEKLEKIINRVPAVALLGPRQIGKTTLAREITRKRSSVYLDLESPEDLLKLRDPFSFLSGNSDKLIILDEIHRFPDLFMILRGLIDQNRRAGKKAGQFLLLFVLFFAKMAPAICSAVPGIGGMILGLRPIPTK